MHGCVQLSPFPLRDGRKKGKEPEVCSNNLTTKSVPKPFNTDTQAVAGDADSGRRERGEK